MVRLAVLLVLVAGCGGSDVSRELGARCDDSSECDDRCLLPEDDWPGGLCTVMCDDDTDCPDEADCADEEGGVCLFTCDEVEDCRFLGLGWTCQTLPAHPSGEGVRVCVGA